MPTDTLIIRCSEPHSAGPLDFIAGALVLANLGACTKPYGRDETSATIELALIEHGVRRIVILGHTGCRAHGEDLSGMILTVREQLWNLTTHPAVAARLFRGELKLEGKVYDRQSGRSHIVTLDSPDAVIYSDRQYENAIAVGSRGHNCPRPS